MIDAGNLHSVAMRYTIAYHQALKHICQNLINNTCLCFSFSFYSYYITRKWKQHLSLNWFIDYIFEKEKERNTNVLLSQGPIAIAVTYISR